MTARRGRPPGSARAGVAMGLAGCVAWVAGLSPSARAGETLLQVISRENPLLRCKDASLTVGRDGMVYLSCAGHDTGFVMRLSRDGKDRYEKGVTYAIQNATANADGVVASAHGHFAHKVVLYDRKLEKTGELADFLVSDAEGWDAPSHVEAGPSGDFYGIDQHRSRILRVSPRAKLVKSYRIPEKPAGGGCFRVCEAKEALYVRAQSGAIRCVGFDGEVRWECPANLAGQWYLQSQPFDVDDEGVLYLLENRSDTVKRYSPEGKALPPVKLDLAGRAPPEGRVWFFALRVRGGDIFVRSEHDTELFQRYDAATGAFRQSVTIDYERLTVSFPGLVWTAGTQVPFSIRFESARGARAPVWRVWARPYESADYRELALEGDSLKVPADVEGLYLVKVTPETQPWQRGTASEYMVRAFVEVRRPGARGSLTTLTPRGRVHFAAGETVPFSIILRAPEGAGPVGATIALVDGPKLIIEKKAELPAGAAPAEFSLGGEVTAALRPGKYLISAEAPEFTCTPQRIVIGPGSEPDPYWRVQYGDYEQLYPSASAWDAPEVVAAHAAVKRALGLDLIVDRIGCHLQVGNLEWANDASSKGLVDSLRARLAADPAGVAPEKALAASPLLQTMAAYGAWGIREMAILMYMDAGLPLGTGHDGRAPDKLREDIRRVTEAMRPYPAFRGWTWSSNWWIYGKRGSAAADTPEEKAAYEAALKRAQETGAWDPVLEKVSDRRLALAVDAQELFKKELRSAAPDAGLVTAVAAPYRNVESYPPATFSNVDEVDLHIQWEQIAVPYTEPFNVDFCKRPGKRGWAHPEVWNDDGTGGQILACLFQSIMRGADGVGCSGPIPPWAGHGGGLPDDPRIAHYGTASVYRALHGFLRRYGPWLATLESDDPVAIVASGRMFRIDEWRHVTGLHFARVLEAYVSCLLLHRPASVVFAEDLKPGALEKFRAVLVVGQRVEMEPAMKAALQAAAKAGTAVFHDGTCRGGLVEGFTPLGVSFDKLEKDPSPAGDDAAYWRFLGCAEANLPGLMRTLGAAVPPVAEVPRPEVLLTRRRSGEGRYLFVVNNTLPRLEPGQLWRMTLGLTTRVPVRVPVGLGRTAGTVYEVLALKRVEPEGGVVQADLRSNPARIFALLPAAIDQVELVGPESAALGSPFEWRARVLDARGAAIAASVPVRVRLLASDKSVLCERFAAAGPEGARGTMTVPVNAPAGDVVLEAAELLGGLSAGMTLSPSPARALAFREGAAGAR